MHHTPKNNSQLDSLCLTHVIPSNPHIIHEMVYSLLLQVIKLMIGTVGQLIQGRQQEAEQGLK